MTKNTINFCLYFFILLPGFFYAQPCSNITVFIDDEDGFNNAVGASGASLAGIEDWELTPDLKTNIIGPLTPTGDSFLGIPMNNIYPGTNPAIGLTVQSNTLNGAASPSPRTNYAFTLYHYPPSVVNLTHTVLTNVGGDSFDMLFDLGTGGVTAASFTPLYYDIQQVSLTDNLKIRVFDTSGTQLCGIYTIIGGNRVTESSFVGVVSNGPAIGRINIEQSDPDMYLIGADNIAAYFTSSCATEVHCFLDSDGDGYGNPDLSAICCEVCPQGYTTDNTDCDDENPNKNPGLIEVCDFIDNNCDGMIDEGFTIVTCYRDYDGDGYGRPNTGVQYCEICPPGLSLNDADCNDYAVNINPDGVEICDGIDNDCDGTMDNGYTTMTCYVDNDGDGYGVPVYSIVTCGTCPSGFSIEDTDCDDTNPNKYPGLTEVCDFIDNNCDGAIDEGFTYITCYLDFDKDGMGDPLRPQEFCDICGDGYVSNSDDVVDNPAQEFVGAGGSITEGNTDYFSEVNLVQCNGGLIGSTVALYQVCLVDLAHTWSGDLEITLISPMGTPLSLSNRNGSIKDHNGTICFDEVSAIDPNNAQWPESGNYLAEGPPQNFSVFDGESPNGTWTLRIIDHDLQDNGSMTDWRILFACVSECEITCPSSPIVIDIDSNMGCSVFVSVPTPAISGCMDMVTNNFNGTVDASDIYSAGTTSVTFTGMDAQGIQSSCMVDVIVRDNNPPAFTNCPEDLFLTADYKTGGATLDIAPFLVSDECSLISSGINYSVHQNGSFGPDEFLSKATSNVNIMPPCSFVEEEIRFARVFDISDLGIFDPGQTVTIESVDFVMWNNYPRYESVTINIYTFDPGTATPSKSDATFIATNSITYPHQEDWTLVNHPIYATFPSDAVVLVEWAALSPSLNGDFLSLGEDGHPDDIETGDTFVAGCESTGLFTDWTNVNGTNANVNKSNALIQLNLRKDNEYAPGDLLPVGGPYQFGYTATDAAMNTETCSFFVTVAEPIPTLSQWGIVLLGLCLSVLSIVAIRQKIWVHL